jgi:hypothetical protein
MSIEDPKRRFQLRICRRYIEEQTSRHKSTWLELRWIEVSDANVQGTSDNGIIPDAALATLSTAGRCRHFGGLKAR